MLAERRACLAEQAGGVPQEVFPGSLRGELPYKYADPLKILGVWWDCRLCFADHIRDGPAVEEHLGA